MYNVAGQMVKTLCDGWRTSGQHDVSITATGLPGGVYFVQFIGGNDSLTKKLVVLR
jgi:hypothetical protein